MKILFRRSLYTLGGLIAVLGLFHLEENWRGRRAWADWQRQQDASRNAFDLASFVPPPVADGDNFAKVPLIADAIEGRRPLETSLGVGPHELDAIQFGWRTGTRVDLDRLDKLLAGRGGLQHMLESSRPGLDAFLEASRKPGCRVSMDYARFPEIQIPAFLGFRNAARTLSLRALAELREGKNDAAFEDVSALFRTVHLLRKEPILIVQLLRLALTDIALQPTWEGLQAHAWSQEQLQALQRQVGGLNLLESFARTWRFEQGLGEADHLQVVHERPWQRTYYPSSYSDSAKPGRVSSILRHLLIPRGWILQDAVSASRNMTRIILAPLDVSEGRIDPRLQDQELQTAGSGFRMPFGPHWAQIFRLFADQDIRVANDQASLDEASVACRLEQYRLEKKAYPERLSDLAVPLPMDVIGGQPLHYRRTADGGYVLYSVGWNARDDGGDPGQGKDALTQGDWVWRISGRSN